MEGLNSNQDPVRQAEMEILAIRGQVHQMGSNNYEFSALNDLVSQMKAGRLSPEEAIRQAMFVRDSKGEQSN